MLRKGNLLADKLRPNVKVYGPYLRYDGRKHVVIYRSDKTTTVSYPKWIMEQYLGRFLTDDETVDHIDRDYTNDDINNLRIVGKREHAAIDSRQLLNKTQKAHCVYCKKEFIVSTKTLDNAVSRNLAGPFCSRACSGLYGTDIQKGAHRLPCPEPVKHIYTRSEKDPADIGKEFELVILKAPVLEPVDKTLLKSVAERRAGANPAGGTKIENHCFKCNKVISKTAITCRHCRNIDKQTITVWPTVDELLKRLKTQSYVSLAKELGVSDNAIRKHLRVRDDLIQRLG